MIPPRRDFRGFTLIRFCALMKNIHLIQKRYPEKQEEVD
jgi:hypothetical protein